MARLLELTSQLTARQDLAAGEVVAAAAALAATEESAEAKGGFLTAFAAKGETPAEIAGFATAFRLLAVNPGVEAWAPRALDIVGTGGDASHAQARKSYEKAGYTALPLVRYYKAL